MNKINEISDFSHIMKVILKTIDELKKLGGTPEIIRIHPTALNLLRIEYLENFKTPLLPGTIFGLDILTDVTVGENCFIVQNRDYREVKL